MRASASARSVPARGAGDEVACERARSLDLARREMRARRLGCATIGVRTILRRRQAKRVLAEFGRDDRRALELGSLRRLLERSREVGVRPVGREREMTRAGDRIIDEIGEAAVRPLPLARGQSLVEDRGEQWCVNRTVPCSSSITCSRSAGSSALCSMPARPSSETVSRACAEASTSASCVAPVKPSSRADTSSSSRSGTGSGCVGSANGALAHQRPGELERIERVAARGLVQPQQRRPCHRRESRPRSSWWIAPTLSGPTRTRSIRSGSSAFSTARRLLALLRADASRRAACSPRAAGEARTRARSPTRHRATGGRRSRRRARPRRAAAARCEPQLRAPAGRPDGPPHPRGGARPRAPDAAAPSGPAGRLRELRRTGRPGRRGRARCSDSAGREESTRNPRPRAVSTAALQSVDFPIPASPSSAIATGPAAASRRSRNAYRDLRSSSLPMTSTAMCLARHRDRAHPESQVREALNGVADLHASGGGDGAVDAEGQRLVMAIGPVARRAFRVCRGR